VWSGREGVLGFIYVLFFRRIRFRGVGTVVGKFGL
jgi:hypothetical protein